jgi:selenocysteine lyase/cysteine desulfurase
VNADRFPAVIAAATRGRVLADNAAGAQLPDIALERMHRYLSYDNAQKGVIFARSRATVDLVEEAKEEFATMIGAPLAQVGVGPNATTLSLSFSRLIASTIKRGDRIVVTAADHEANVAPWMWLQRFGAQVHIVPVDANGDLDEAQYRAFLDREPVLVALPWASNTTGTVFDVARLAGSAKAVGSLVVVDAVQAFPHMPLDLPVAIDFAFFSAYKIYAPHVGFWYVSRRALERFVQPDDANVAGGDARSWSLETGTQSYEALAGWLGTVAYLRELAPKARDAMAEIARYEGGLCAHARKKFAERRGRVKLYGRSPEVDRLPVFTFNVQGVASEETARRFERANVEARVGDYYSPRLMRTIAGAAGGRAVRLSFSHYNTVDEVDRCFDVIDDVLEHPEPENESVEAQTVPT